MASDSRQPVFSKRVRINTSASPLRRRFQLAPHILLPLACPLVVGHADEDVAQQLQMQSIQQGGTRWRPVRKDVLRTIKGPS
jgi:hypothetical protein